MKFITIYVKTFQSIYDLAVEQYGSVDHIDILMTDNPDIDLENELLVNTPIKIRTEFSVLDEKTRAYFQNNNENIASSDNVTPGPGYTPGTTNCADGVAVVKNSLNETLLTFNVPSNGIANASLADVEVQLGGNTLGVHPVKPVVNIPLKVYYNRPNILNVPSYVTYDEGWMYANNYDPSFYPTDGVLQQSDFAISPDYLKYFNAFGHKFRLVGLNGGYYNFNDGTYRTVNGALSTYEAEFRDPVSGSGLDGYIIDTLTGIGYRALRGGGQAFDAAIAAVASTTLFGWSDWRIPTMLYLETLKRYGLSQQLLRPFRPPFHYDQTNTWSCTTSVVNTSQAYYLGSSNITTLQNKITAVNRTFSRLHYARNQFVIQP